MLLPGEFTSEEGERGLNHLPSHSPASGQASASWWSKVELDLPGAVPGT